LAALEIARLNWSRSHGGPVSRPRPMIVEDLGKRFDELARNHVATMTAELGCGPLGPRSLRMSWVETKLQGASMILPTNLFESHAISVNITQVLVTDSQINVVATLMFLGYFCSSASSAAAVQSIVSSGDILLSGASRASLYPIFSMSKRY
jgi:hypothetical protein